ncbi:MAG: saccharopine dehydrogenase family protein [Promethearchaeota archaeon]
MKKKWMIYGAYGYTGELLSYEAIKRGHKPVLAGRSTEKLIPLAKKLDLDYIIFDLDDENKIFNIVKDFDLVFNSAGPYKYTNDPMVKSCLKAGVNYLDVTGELPIMEKNFTYDQQARDQDIAVISGVGFDVVPTDCMAKYVSDKIINPTHLEIAIAGIGGGVSAGTLKTMLEYSSMGTLIRKDGQLVKPLDRETRKIRFLDKERKVNPISWGDLSTAYRSTKEFDIKERIKWVEKNIHGPDEKTRLRSKSQIWVHAFNDRGENSQAWLETMEGYRFTAIAGIRSVEKVFELEPKGVLTPSLAFGTDFILEFPETMRIDAIDEYIPQKKRKVIAAQ